MKMMRENKNFIFNQKQTLPLNETYARPFEGLLEDIIF